jgi:hypothetical protein
VNPEIAFWDTTANEVPEERARMVDEFMTAGG